MLVCLCVVLLGACRRDDDAAQTTPTATPTLFVATASPAGIAGPPKTAQPGSGDPQRARAEAFLRRVALTEADIPGYLSATISDFLDGSQLAARTPNEAYNRTQWGTVGLVLSLVSRFESPAGRTETTDGVVQRVTNTGLAFRLPDGAQSTLDSAGGLRSLEEQISDRATGVMAHRLDDLPLGEGSRVWRATGRSKTNPAIEIAAWQIVIRRGAAIISLAIEGSNPVVDRLARDLAQRLDQRLAVALPSAWP